MRLCKHPSVSELEEGIGFPCPLYPFSGYEIPSGVSGLVARRPGLWLFYV